MESYTTTLRNFATSSIDDGQNRDPLKEDSFVNLNTRNNVTQNIISDHDDHLTHVDESGNAAMVNVNNKADTIRNAKAQGKILLGKKAFDLVQKNQMKKGDVLTVSQLAGIMGAKQTSNLIPLCHPLLLNKIDVNLTLDHTPGSYSILVNAEVECCGKTGVEMEALTAVSVALLTVYDMCKAVTKDMQIQDVRLVAKTGGKSDYRLGCSTSPG